MRHSAATDPQIAVLARTVEEVADIVEISDRECRIQYVNRAFEQLTGYSREEVIGRTFYDLLCEKQHDKAFAESVMQTVLSGNEWTGRMVSVTKDGQRLSLVTKISPELDESGQVCQLVAVKRDTTEREVVQKQLTESERLWNVGQVAAGVTNAINNPLSLILANAESLSEQIVELESQASASILRSLRSSIAEITQDVERIRDVVRDLGAFSRSGDEVPESVDVREVIESTLSLLGNQINLRAKLVRNYQDIPPTWARRSQLGQVFLNLILNAVQAIPVRSAQNHQIRVATRASRAGIILVEVSDTGAGIPAKILPRIFDPLFTTRVLGQDVGLRLAVSQNIVNSMGGELSVHSTVNHGTTFIVSLPPSQEQTRRDETERGPEVDPSRGYRVLVIDDEAGVLRVIKRILKDHNVTTCLGGKEALEHLRSGNFDLILCDLMMPEYTGMDLYEIAAEERPDLLERFLFVTGGAFTKQTESFLRGVSKEAVGKPFTTAELREAVNKRLSRLSVAR